MSPHLMIYRPQLTSMLSITHRITGTPRTGTRFVGTLSAVLFSGAHACGAAAGVGVGGGG